ncbi:MGMT family protein [Multifurca ochricompacta]|uniref:MGMT family protein n=1 Tax=Multifurca ochricompacta TaxID=376703 RepID=A0AAD4LUG1_9AGAM|nr:MGMT family protein [Multifurca ochricompacta]KAI0294072.1 MGMT family protein [Multifurca ochricompacta]
MTLDVAEFHEAVYSIVRQIPQGKVTTYGHVAKLIDMPSYSRHVGQALKYLSPEADPPVPWQRVVSSVGKISSRGPGTDGAQRQREALEAENVQVHVGRAFNEFLVDLRAYGWFPAPGTITFGAPQ